MKLSMIAAFFAVALSAAAAEIASAEMSRPAARAPEPPSAPATPMPVAAPAAPAAREASAPVALATPAALPATPAPATPPTPPAAAPAPSYTMRTYIVGFLRKGPKWTPEKTEETKKIQEGHLANINRMAETGKLILAGPFSDSGDLRGMFVFDLTDVEEAKAMAEQDPAVQAGRLVIDWHPWYSASGIRSDAIAPAPATPAATPAPAAAPQ